MSGITLGNILEANVITFGESKTWSAVAVETATAQTVEVPGVETSDLVFVQKPTEQSGLTYISAARVSAANTISIVFSNAGANGGGNVTPTAEESWTAVVYRAEFPKKTSI